MLAAVSRWASIRPSSARSNMRSCRSTCRRTKFSAAPGWSKRAPISPFSAGQSSPASWHRARPSRQRARSASRSSGYLAGRQVPPAPPAAERIPLDLPHRPRVDQAGQRDDAHPATVPRDPRDQLLLDHRRGADHHLPAAGEERARRRTSRSRACSSRFSRSASRSARCHQPPVEERGLGPLRAGVRDRDGRVRARSSISWP